MHEETRAGHHKGRVEVQGRGQLLRVAHRVNQDFSGQGSQRQVYRLVRFYAAHVQKCVAWCVRANLASIRNTDCPRDIARMFL